MKTMMRIDRQAPLASGAKTTFKGYWSCFIKNATLVVQRTDYELLEREKTTS